MKLFLFLFLLPFYSFSQESLPVINGKVQYEEIDSIPGATREGLYSKSKAWIAKSFASAQDVIQLDDKETGQIIGKGVFRYDVGNYTWTCMFTIQIDCRDNKTRIKIYDISDRGSMEVTAEYFNKYPGHNKKHIKAVNDGVLGTLASYRGAVNKTPDTF